jgi:formate hydrogenlyase subunit 3/multisubunit Na+/H+ antiporter MnhD subunit
MISINPGFALILGAVLMIITPRFARFPIFLSSALGACALLFIPAFGEYASISQIGIELAPLRLDAQSQVFGLCLSLIAIMTALASASRDDRLEDFAAAIHVGAALAAVCAGDLVTFIAAAELSALASVALIAMRGAGASGASMRLFAWHALAGVCLLTGAAFHLADGAPSQFQAVDATSAGGALMLVGLCLRIGAPPAHIWKRDALLLTSPIAATALAASTAILASYGLARAFAGEQALLIVGAAMVGVAVIYAMAQGDLRRAGAYAILAQFGVVAALIGVGGPDGLRAAAAMSFSVGVASAMLALALGLAAGAGARRPFADGAPASLDLRLAIGLAGLCLAGAPGAMGFISLTMAHQAIAADGRALLMIGFSLAAGAAALHTGLRFLTALAPFPGGVRPDDSASFPARLALLLAAFVIVAAGVSPGWLMSFAPVAANSETLAQGDFLRFTAIIGAAFAAGFLLKGLGLDASPFNANLRDWDEAFARPMLSLWSSATTLAPLAGDKIAEWNAAAGARLLTIARALLAQGDRPGRAAGQGDTALLLALAFGLGWALISLTL